MVTDLWDRVTVPAGVAPTIIRFETDVLHPYRDSVGVWTEGDGDTVLMDGQRVTAHSPPLTVAQSEALLQRDEARYGAAIDHAIPVPLTVVQVVPLYSFVHNLGTGALEGSMIARMLVAGDVALAAAQWPGWCLAGGHIELGLLRRRYAEMLMFLGSNLEAAYVTAWRMSLAALMPAYHKAFSDAAAWRGPAVKPAGATPVHTVPRTVIIRRPAAAPDAATGPAPETADDLMQAELAGTLNLPGT